MKKKIYAKVNFSVKGMQAVITKMIEDGIRINQEITNALLLLTQFMLEQEYGDKEELSAIQVGAIDETTVYAIFHIHALTIFKEKNLETFSKIISNRYLTNFDTREEQDTESVRFFILTERRCSYGFPKICRR